MTGALLALWLFGGLTGHSAADDCDDPGPTIAAVLRQWPLRPEGDPVSVYVQELGTRLGVAAQTVQVPQFRVVRNLQPMAFALGGHRFVISDGLVVFVRGRDDLAAVLAHELAHERLGHFCRPSGKARKIRIGAVVQHEDLDKEQAADAEARRVLAAAGLNPNAMASVLECLSAVPGADSVMLRARLDALAPGPKPKNVDEAPDFERVRAGVLDQFGGEGTTCR